MKVVALHTNFSLGWPARLSALASRLEGKARLHAVEATGDKGPYTFAGDEQGETGYQSSVLFGHADLSSLRPADVAQRTYATLDDLKPDVVLAGAIAFTPGATAVRWARSRRRGVVIMDDARDVDVPRSGFVNAIKRRFYANVDAMLVPAPSHRATCTGFGVAASRVFFGVDVVDNNAFAAQAEAYRAEARRDELQNIDSVRSVEGDALPRNFFLGVGRQVIKKNWRLLVEAYARYRAQLPKGHGWDLVLLGEGPERPALEAIARSGGVAGVHFLPFLPPSQIARVYANAKCLILPSFFGETWGLVVNEAMACGLPVIVSQEAGCRETLVQPGENGFAFSPHSVDDLCAALGRMAVQDEPALARMGDCSRRIVAEWGLERFAAGAADAIEAVSGVRRGFSGPMDRLILSGWKGRFRPT